MRLAEYLQREGEGYSGFGRRIGRGPETVRRYCLPREHGESRVPDRAGMVAIYVATGGRVTPNDFYDLPPLEHEEKAA